MGLKGAEQEWRTLKFQAKEIEPTIKRCEANLERAEKRLEMRNAVLKELVGEKFDLKKLPESLPLRLRMGDKTILDEKAIATALDGILEKQLTGGKENPRWIIAVKKEIPGGSLEINGIRFEARMIKGVELSIFANNVQALVRHGDVTPIQVMESRSPATQLMGNIRYEMRSIERTMELAKQERGQLESNKRSCERRLATAENNFESARKDRQELHEKVQALAGEVGMDGKGKPSLAVDADKTNGVENNSALNSLRRVTVQSSKEEGVEMEV